MTFSQAVVLRAGRAQERGRSHFSRGLLLWERQECDVAFAHVNDLINNSNTLGLQKVYCGYK